MKFLVAVVLLACASTATAGLFDYKKYPAPKPVCTKGCKADYEVCKPVEVEEEQCPKPVYVAPVYKGKYHGRKLNDYKPKYVPAPTPAPVCKKVKVIKQVCTKAPCTVTELVDKTTCELVCDAKHGRKLSDYKPKYTPAPVYVAPKPKCENKCTTVKVPVTKCLEQCVYDICPSPKPTPAPKPVYHKPTPAPEPEPEHKPKYDFEDIKKKISDAVGKYSKHD